MKTKIREVNKSYKYRIYPSFEQEEYINHHINNSRFIFNKVKEMYDRYWIKTLTNSHKINYFLNKSIYNMYLKEIKKKYSFIQDMDTISAQKVYKRLIKGFQNININININI
ncbi:MAG: helix-turn-helix domain-containing protein [Methanobrevibacter sp.]|jgi:putative transposase|nr:helix-turn-helix domain-containing protein [Candidatus Methanovirga basalitermitum]